MKDDQIVKDKRQHRGTEGTKLKRLNVIIKMSGQRDGNKKKRGDSGLSSEILDKMRTEMYCSVCVDVLWREGRGGVKMKVMHKQAEQPNTDTHRRNMSLIILV